MNWLAGKPVRRRSLIWPSGDAILDSCGWMREGTSVMDGVILYWFAFTMNHHRTTVYVADTRENKTSIVINRIAELDFAAHGIVLIGDGFASAQWLSHDRGLKFRLHSLDGSTLRECTSEAAAVYGQLGVSGTAISMCIASGAPLPQNIFSEALANNANDQLRLGGEGDSEGETNLSLALLADEITEWDTASGNLKKIKIPQNPAAPLVHSTNYIFLSHDKIALAGLVDEPQQAVLACFSDQVDEPACRIFSAGASSAERMVVGQAVSHPGSTEPSDILIHQHDRITVFKRGLLAGDTSSSRSPPEGLRMVWKLSNDARILNHAVTSQAGLPGVCGNRVITHRKLSQRYVLYVLDFDQARVATLVAKNTHERGSLSGLLSEFDARVRVITRRFQCKEEGVGSGFDDAEYSSSTRPTAWQDHIRNLQKRDKEEEKIGVEGNQPLEYDEAPAEHREPMPFGFIQSVLRLGSDVSWQDIGRMAITTDCVVMVPEPGQDGTIYDFVE